MSNAKNYTDLYESITSQYEKINFQLEQLKRDAANRIFEYVKEHNNHVSIDTIDATVVTGVDEYIIADSVVISDEKYLQLYGFLCDESRGIQHKAKILISHLSTETICIIADMLANREN